MRPAHPPQDAGSSGQVRAPARAVRRPRYEDEGEPERQGSNVVLWLAVGGLGVLVVGAVGVAATYFLLAARRATAPAPVAVAGPAPSVPAPAAAPPAPAPADKPAPPAAAPVVTSPAPAPADKPAQPAVRPAPARPTPPAAKVTPGELYGDQGGEPVAPADASLPNTVMRARRDDTFLKLSNPRVGQTSGRGPKRNALLVDYEVVSRGKFDGGTLVLHTDDGGRAEVALSSITGRDHGTIELVGARRFGNITLPRNTTFPENVEMYVTRGDDRYDPPSRFMVSNSVVMGTMKATTRPRDWTPDEVGRYTKPPPSYKSPNAYPDVGEDVPALTGGGNFRYVEPDGRLLGLEYHLGEWGGEKCVGGLVPVFSANQPPSKPLRVVARPGYAVAGAEVHSGKLVYAIRLLFRRVKPDGSLDAGDAYAGEWIGTPPAGEAKTLVNDGRQVLGIHFQQGAVIDRFGLVVKK